MAHLRPVRRCGHRSYASPPGPGRRHVGRGVLLGVVPAAAVLDVLTMGYLYVITFLAGTFDVSASTSSSAVRARHAVHKPHRRGGAGQRLQQLHDPVRKDEMHHHQIHRERLQVRAVPRRAGPGRGMGPAAPTADPMLIVLGDAHLNLRDLMLLVPINHPQIPPRCPDPAHTRSDLAGTGPGDRPGKSENSRFDPRAPGCLPGLRFEPRPGLVICSGGSRPGSSSFDGGEEELPLFRDTRCSTRTSLPARSSRL